MAKMVKCPQCGTQIEVPTQPSGQVIKCPTCGKGLKLVAKKAGGQPAGQQGSGMSLSPGGSMAGGSSAGSISAMTFTGEPPPSDDFPNLDSNCAVCGRATDPEKLVEDNGRLLCPDCIKGARSKVERAGPVESFEFKSPVPPPVKRASIISITPTFMIGAIAALILIACQVYLTLVVKPEGKMTAGAAMIGKQPGAATVAPTDTNPDLTPPPNSTTSGNPATQPSGAAPPTEPPTTVAINTKSAGTTLTPPAPAPTNPENPATPATNPGSRLFPPTEEPSGETPTPPAPPPAPDATAPTVSAPPTPTSPGGAPSIVAASSDPLAQGMEKLQVRDYKGAYAPLESARMKYVVRGHKPGDKLTPEQQMTLVGLAAANLGLGKPDAAKGQLDIVIADGQKTRSAVIDYAIALLNNAPPKRPNTRAQEFGMAIDAMKTYLGSAHDDEYAANIYGTLLEKGAAFATTKEQKEKFQQFIAYLDEYNDQLGRETHPDQLKWGIDWMPKELVQQYRSGRDRPAGAAPLAAPQQLQQDFAQAKARVMQLQKALDEARSKGGDIVGAQNQLDAASAAAFRLQMQMDRINAVAPKPKWLDKFEPVIPEGTVATQ